MLTFKTFLLISENFQPSRGFFFFFLMYTENFLQGRTLRTAQTKCYQSIKEQDGILECFMEVVAFSWGPGGEGGDWIMIVNGGEEWKVRMQGMLSASRS